MLEILIDRAGEIVTRQDLVDRAWEGLAVSPDAVRYALRQVRIALADPVDQPQFVETVARRGWRFIGGVKQVRVDQYELIPAGDVDPSTRRQERDQGTRLLVGREAEWSVLREALGAAQLRRPQVVFVVGEAGIGKTRLVEDFVDEATERAGVLTARGECIEHHGAGQPYMPLLEALERAAVSQGGEVPAAILRRHAPTWLAQLPSLSEPEDRHALAEETEGASQARMIRELQRAFERFAERRPVVLWLDDLHWADQSTVDAVISMAEKVADAAIMVIATLRPGEAAGSSLASTLSDLESRRRCTVIRPEPLDVVAIRSYLGGRFGASSEPARSGNLVSALLGAGAGLPLILVSLVDELVSEGGLALGKDGWFLGKRLELEQVPARVESLLARSLDTLSDEAREALEVGSVVGLDFSVFDLASVVSASVDSLERLCDELVEDGRFLQARGSVGWPDGSVGSGYRFTHSLYRNVLYERLSAGRASRIHYSVGQRKEAGFASRLDGVASELARHFELGLDFDRAFAYRLRAGEDSARRSSNLEATEHFRHALALVSRINEDDRLAVEVQVRLSFCAPLAAVAGYGAPELAENLERIEVLTVDLEESPLMIPVLLGLWSLNLVRGDIPTSATLAARLIRIANSTDEASYPIARLQAHRAMGHSLLYSGELEAGESHFSLALNSYDIRGHTRQDYSIGDDPVVLVHSYRSWSLWFYGFSQQASTNAVAALEYAERLDHPPSLAFALAYGSVFHHLRGDVGTAWEWSDRLIELAGDEDLVLWLALGKITHGWALSQEADPENGITMLRSGLAEWDSMGALLGKPYFVSVLAEILGRVGLTKEALALIPPVIKLAHTTGQTMFLPECYRVEGELLMQQASSEAARRLAIARLDEAVRVARSGEALSLELRAALSLSNQLEKTGDRDRGIASLRSTFDRFSEGFEDPDLARARRILEG